MDATVVWALLLLGIAAILIVLELFVPSGGLIGVFAAASLIGGIVMLFKVNQTLGILGAIVAVAAAPFVLAGIFKLWPNTPIARRMMLQPNEALEESEYVTPTSVPQEVSRLVGAKGRALSDLRPVGACLINGERTECLAESGVIRAGEPVQVVSADGMNVKVRADSDA